MSQYYEAPTLENMGLSPGKRTRLHRLLYEHGPGNGRMLVLPIDQGLEHGPADFFPNPDSKFPDFQYQLAEKGGYSAIALHIGLAMKYQDKYASAVPLILKLNGKTNIPPDDEPFSPLVATVEDAVRLGAEAVGYTLYAGSPRQDEDFAQFAEVRSECDLLGMPLIVWAYPRGEAVERKGGRNSFYAADYATRVAQELGADVVKVNFPVVDPDKDKDAPDPYSTLEINAEEALKHVIRSAGSTMVLVSGGSKVDEKELLRKAEAAIKAGATGLIFGRNMWQRTMDDALALTKRIKEIMLSR